LFSKMHPHFKPIKIKKNAVCSSSKSYISWSLYMTLESITTN
jgi:hypothetical protein